MKIKISILILGLLAACTAPKKPIEDLQQQYVNVLDIQGIPQKQFGLPPFGFSDLGAWHGYALPSKDSTAYYGGFIGPLSMKMKGQWLSKSLCKLQILNEGKAIDLSKAKVKINYYPGKLQQQLILKKWKIDIDLFFVSNRSNVLQTTITNTSNTDKKINLAWQGNIFPKGLKIVAINNGICVNFEKSTEQFLVQSDKNLKVNLAQGGKAYRMDVKQPLKVKTGESVKIQLLQSHYFTTYEVQSERDSLAVWLNQPEKLLLSNQNRWNHYLQGVFKHKTELLKDEKNKKLAVKCVETLLTNWRSPAGDLQYDGLFPSAAYQGFYGFWSWDSWKQAVALVRFFPKLAKSNISSMFQYQDSLGMVADCVYFNPKENNWRDTKAPLASWAVLKVFEATQDTAFVREIYPKLLKYHQWWYTYRDYDQNGLCEYGSTDGTLIAAKWESGMDNAVRFDNTKMLQNNTVSWSMNQESVDLNAYLCAEKKQLSVLANALGKTKEAQKLAQASVQLKKRIQTDFWDAKSGFFYDRELKTGKILTVQQGTEGWTPLYTVVANLQQAKSIKKVIESPYKFNTKMPLPTLSAQNKKFNPLKGYWRGPVWIDQAYFGIKGLERYGYNALANTLTQHLLQNAQGLLETAPIRENYHPITGEGLNANHFSWSAAHYLMLLTDRR